MILRSEDSSVVCKPDSPYDTTRLLVGTFVPAVNCLKKGLIEIGATGFFRTKPYLVIYPKEMNEDGLSEVEERCLLELGYAVGAKKVEVK